MQPIAQLTFPLPTAGHGAMRPTKTKLVLSCVKNFFVQTVSSKVRSLVPKKPQYLPTYSAITLPGLPKELIQLIASFLPPHEEALLILTCKVLLHTLGTHSWLIVSSLVKERKIFMHLLERDLPNYYAYYYHLRRKLPYSYPSNLLQNSTRHYMTDRDWLLPFARFGYAVSWSHVVFALRADSFGASYGIPLDAFAYDSYQRIGYNAPKYTKLKKIKTNKASKVSKFGRLREDDVQVQLSARARIVSGHLILRCIYTVSNKKRPANLDDLKTLGLDVCGHISTTYRNEPWYVNILADSLRGPSCKWAPYDGSGWADHPVSPSQQVDPTTTAGIIFESPATGEDRKEVAEDLVTVEDVLGANADDDYSGQCSFCFTEYSVQEASLKPNNGIEVVVWHDLGNGKSTDGVFWVQNSHWKALVGEESRDYPSPHMCSTFRYIRSNSIRNAFEDGDGSRLCSTHNTRQGWMRSPARMA